MTRVVPIVLLVAVIVLSIAAPVIAVPPGSGGAGVAFGLHHAEMAQEGGFSGEMNPGVHHQGFSGWTGPME